MVLFKPSLLSKTAASGSLIAVVQVELVAVLKICGNLLNCGSGKGYSKVNNLAPFAGEPMSISILLAFVSLPLCWDRVVTIFFI